LQFPSFQSFFHLELISIICFQCPGIRPRHALIEYCPRSEKFWLRQLLPFEDIAVPSRQMTTTKNGVPGDDGQMAPPPPYPYAEEEEEEEANAPSSRKSTQEQVLQDGMLKGTGIPFA
jgi:hypothetical protein